MHAHNIVVILLCPHPTKGERGSGGGGGGGGGRGYHNDFSADP